MSMEYSELLPDKELVQKLIALSSSWEDEQSCRGYVKNSAEEITGNRVFAARINGEIIAYLFGNTETAAHSTSVMPQGTVYFEVDELYVRPEYRSSGIGRQLFRLMEDTVRNERCEFILLSTSSKNYKSILHFYIDELGMDFWSARLFKKI